MDYLNIIATRSLVLFKPIRTPHGSDSGPSTPTNSLITPPPIPMPIESIMDPKYHSQIAYFLMQHVLASQTHLTTNNAMGTVSRDVMIEAEVMVWKEIDQCVRFVRKLGNEFGSRGRIEEGEMKALAKEFGLGLKKEEASTPTGSDYSTYSHHGSLANEGNTDAVLA